MKYTSGGGKAGAEEAHLLTQLMRNQTPSSRQHSLFFIFEILKISYPRETVTFAVHINSVRKGWVPDQRTHSTNDMHSRGPPMSPDIPIRTPCNQGSLSISFHSSLRAGEVRPWQTLLGVYKAAKNCGVGQG